MAKPASFSQPHPPILLWRMWELAWVTPLGPSKF